MNDIKNSNDAFKDDLLDVKSIAYELKEVLLSSQLNVIAITAKWGGGKTYFMKNLCEIMKYDTIGIFYNAWESDIYKDPLIAILTALLDCLESLLSKSIFGKFKKIITKFLKNLKFSVGINLTGLSVTVQKIKYSKKFLNYEHDKSIMQNFKEELKKLQTKITKKIIIYIDELDRCSPEYTIHTLEVIKHFFGIENVIFVLAVDKNQLENSVRTMFGVNQGSEDEYLRKFIDIEFKLPTHNTRDFINDHLNKIKNIIEYFHGKARYYNFNDGQNFIEEIKNINILIYDISVKLNFSLRDIEHFFTRFKVLLNLLKENDDMLLIEPCIVLSALSLRNLLEKFDTEPPESMSSLHDNILYNQYLPHWSGFFDPKMLDSIFYTQNHIYVKDDKIHPNAIRLNKFLLKNICKDLSEFNIKKYLLNYLKKIQYIHYFK